MSEMLTGPKKIVDGLTEVFRGLTQMCEGMAEQIELLEFTSEDAEDEDVVQLTSQSYGINADEQEGILKYLIAGGDLSLYGLRSGDSRQIHCTAGCLPASERRQRWSSSKKSTEYNFDDPVRKSLCRI